MSWGWLVGKEAAHDRGTGEIIEVEEIAAGEQHTVRVVVEIDGVELNTDADRVEVNS